MRPRTIRAAAFTLLASLAPPLSAQDSGLRGVKRVASTVVVGSDLQPYIDESALAARVSVEIAKALPNNPAISAALAPATALIELNWTALPIGDGASATRFAVMHTCEVRRLLSYPSGVAQTTSVGILGVVWSSSGVRVWGVNKVREAAIEDAQDCAVKALAKIMEAR